MPSHISNSKHIVVIGAGITGLQSAVSLQQAGYRVTIIAEHTPGDESPHYTSPWAGGQWRTHAKADDFEQRLWDADTYREWMRIVRAGEGDKAGLGIVPSTLYWSSKISETSPELWWQSIVEDFSLLPASELPEGVRSGVRFTAVCINVPRHLQYLLSSFLASGGKLLKARLSTRRGFAEALKSATALIKRNELGEVYAYVNASGLGARLLVGDTGVFPTRGQTVLVKGEAKFAKTSEQNSYVIPRPWSGTTILGGTREDGIWTTEVSDDSTRAILEGCKLLAPELLNESGDFEVLSVQCGLRPSRTGGVRVMSEIVERTFAVVHSYGHAGAGYQNAVGSAHRVVQLVENLGAQSMLRAKL